MVARPKNGGPYATPARVNVMRLVVFKRPPGYRCISKLLPESSPPPPPPPPPPPALLAIIFQVGISMNPPKPPVVTAPPSAKDQHEFQRTDAAYFPRTDAAGPSEVMHPNFSKEGFGDLEQGYGQQAPLYPNINRDENVLRWAFIRKVYIILSLQLMLTAAVAGVVAFYHPVSDYLVRTPGLLIAMAILPFIILCPLYYYHQKHPINLILLALFTASLSLTIGFTCAFTKGKVIWEAALLTMVVVVSLTLYTFWAVRRGHDFSFLGPILFASLIVIILFIIIQVFFPLGRLSYMIYGGIAALVFSGYIVYDTNNLIKRFTYDEYIWASVSLYLDVINLFLSLLTFFRAAEG